MSNAFFAEKYGPWAFIAGASMGIGLAFTDPANGQRVETELMFPNVLFANVIGD